jgi:hypothetical protein
MVNDRSIQAPSIYDAHHPLFTVVAVALAGCREPQSCPRTKLDSLPKRRVIPVPQVLHPKSVFMARDGPLRQMAQLGSLTCTSAQRSHAGSARETYCPLRDLARVCARHYEPRP